MREMLLWLIGLQKISRRESAIYSGIQDGEINASSSEDFLNKIIKCSRVEEVEKYALTSGGLRTCRAMYYCCELLKNIKDGEKLRALAELEYPYGYLLQKGNELDAIERVQADPDNPNEIELEDTLVDEEGLEEIEEDEEADDSEA